MMDLREEMVSFRDEALRHLEHELMPFWMSRSVDRVNGGFITHFDRDGADSGEDEKSLIAQARAVYSFSSLHRYGYGEGRCAEIARHGVDYLLDRMWDEEHGGFYWMTNRSGRVTIDEKILYGQSFAIYALSEYTLATHDPRGLEYASRVLSLIQEHAADIRYGGYFEMFDRAWNLKGAGSEGGDRKTLDVHMHLMEAFTTLYECSRSALHRRRLEEIIGLCQDRLLHPTYRTGIPQFWANWEVAPQIKFDIVWGWDRFADGGKKEHADDNTSYGHNVEYAWLMLHAFDILHEPIAPVLETVQAQLRHALGHGIDAEYGGVFVEGSHAGEVYDTEKEFWQNAEMLIALLEASLRFGADEFWPAYRNVHTFVFQKMIHHEVGEWWPLLTREGEPIWTHMSHSWKVCYHTIRSMVQSVDRLNSLIHRAG